MSVHRDHVIFTSPGTPGEDGRQWCAVTLHEVCDIICPQRYTHSHSRNVSCVLCPVCWSPRVPLAHCVTFCCSRFKIPFRGTLNSFPASGAALPSFPSWPVHLQVIPGWIYGPRWVLSPPRARPWPLCDCPT